jgi:hypothetical protein
MFTREAFTNCKLLLLLTALLMLSLPTSAEINNCCFIDRQCNTNHEWVSGYYAFHNNQCAAPQPQHAASPQASPLRGASNSINNCCFAGWQCNTNDEWVSGYYAFQANQCDSSQSSWRPRSGAGGTVSVEYRQSVAQELRSNERKRQPLDSRPERVVCHADSWRWDHRCQYQMPWEEVIQNKPTLSITIDLSNPNTRLEEASDGTPVIIHPNQPD